MLVVFLGDSVEGTTTLLMTLLSGVSFVALFAYMYKELYQKILELIENGMRSFPHTVFLSTSSSYSSAYQNSD